MRARSIPAQAGEPRLRSDAACADAVYPRAGGGTAFVEDGVGPRLGLSPRRRGNLRLNIFQVILLGSIPAQAGEP